MDVVLPKKRFDVSGRSGNSVTQVATSELLLAQDFDELVAEVRQLTLRGVRQVSIRRQRARRIGTANLKMVLDDAGLKVCTVGFAGGFTGTLGRSYRQAVDDARRALDFGAELRARAIVVVPGSRGRHIYNHAERVVRDGINDCIDDALRLRVDMPIPLTTVLGTHQDVFRPRHETLLDWIGSFECHRVQAMMMLRRRSPLQGLPACWKRCLTEGGALRIGHRCRKTIGSQAVIAQIEAGLEGFTASTRR